MAAYLIVDLEVTDAAAYEKYREQVPALIAAHGGRYLVRGGAAEVLEGSLQPKRTVILEFPDMPSLKAFWQASDYQPLKALRQRVAKTSVMAVEGI